MTAPVVPRKEAIEVAKQWADYGCHSECAEAIELALRAAEAAERERCARAMCPYCRGGQPRVNNMHSVQYDGGPLIVPCDAAAIREMGQEEMGDGSPDVLRSAPDGAVSRHAALFGGPHPGCVNPYPHDPPACYQMAVNCTECNRKLADCDHVPGAVSRCDGSGRVPAGSLQHAEWRCPGCPACRKEKP